MYKRQAEEYDAAGRSLAPIRNRSRSKRIRLGYFSADYYNHATAHLAAGMFESHDRARFEVAAFSFGPDKNDAMRERLAAGFDRFVEVRAKSDREIVEISRDMQIDIAIDLKGFTQDSRTRIFADRVAPIPCGLEEVAGQLLVGRSVHARMITGLSATDLNLGRRVLLAGGQRRDRGYG